MAERFKAHAWKACWGASLSQVRILFSPPGFIMEKLSTVFVYGTLSFDEIISALLGRKARGAPAKIYGYKIVRITGKRYPGLIKSSNKKSSVEGMVHSDVSSEELKLLNTFEDDFYKLESEIVVCENGKTVTALTYIVPKENLNFASSEEWDRGGFRRKHLADYMKMVSEFRRSYLSGVKKSQEF